MALWRVRATIDDRPGFLAVLAASLALRSVNILAVQVHASEDGAIDDFLVDTPEGMTEAELLAAVERGRGRDAWAALTDVRTLVDAPTRALDLAGRLVREPAAVGEALADLLDARVTWRAEAGAATMLAGLDGQQICLPAPAGGAWLANRVGPSFTPAEYARAQALVGVAAAAAPSAPTLLLADGRELTLRRAGAADLDAVRALHDRCSPATLRQRYMSGATRPPHVPLLRLLVPMHGWTLLAEVADGGDPGRVVAMGNLVPEGAQAELALLVEDTWQRRGIGTAMLRRMVAAAAEAGFGALLAHTRAGNTPILRTLRRLGRPQRTDRDGGMLTVTLPLDAAGQRASIPSATATIADTTSGPANRA